jgi:putative copper export protein/methionine-rich copper-binding protein CopC/mono/diheme cytochrome c family protein
VSGTRSYERRRLPAWCLGGILTLLMTLAVLPVPVSAHVALVGATPVPGSTIGQAPKSVRIRLDQIPDPKFSQITILDTNGQTVAGGPAQADATDPAVIEVALAKTLPPALYTVAWQALAPDGHLTRGNYTFTLAAGLGPAAPAEPQSIGAPTASTPATGASSIAGGGNPSVAAVLIRWWRYLALGLLTGACGLALFVARPATVDTADAEAWRRAARRLRAWASGGIVAFILAHVATAFVQAATVADLPITRVRGDTLRRLLFDTTYGAVWRLTMAVALLLLVGVLVGLLPFWRTRSHALGVIATPRPVARDDAVSESPAASQWFWRLELAGAFLLCAVLPFSSHAVESQHQPVLALMADATHLAAMGLWFGGLVLLLIVQRPWLHPLDADARHALLAAAVRRFSNMAFLCVGALVATGLYAMTIHTTRATILTSSYGKTLLIKHALIVPLIATAAVNLLLIKPHLGESARARRLLPRLLLVEVALGLVVLCVTAVLTQLPPAHLLTGVNAAVADPRLNNAAATLPPVAITPAANLDLTSGPQSAEMQDGPGMTVLLRTTLGKDGSTLEANIVDPKTIQPLPDVQRVTALITFAGADLGQTSVPLTQGDDGLYHASGVFFPIKGVWNIQLVIRRANVAEDARLNFSFTSDPARFQVAQQPASTPASVKTGFLWPRLLPNAWFGLLIALVGALLVLAIRARRSVLRGQTLRVYRVWSIGAVVAGLVMFGYFSVDRTPTTTVANPVPNDTATLTRGAQLYAQNCAVCHGASGKGDGTYGAQLNPRPANLTGTHITTHTDGDLYWWISHGIAGTGMPAWSGTLSDQDMWALVRYLRTLRNA